jgi:hypothetical protein
MHVGDKKFIERSREKLKEREYLGYTGTDGRVSTDTFKNRM